MEIALTHLSGYLKGLPMNPRRTYIITIGSAILVFPDFPNFALAQCSTVPASTVIEHEVNVGGPTGLLPSIAMDPCGRWIVAYEEILTGSNDPNDVRFLRFDADATRIPYGANGSEGTVLTSQPSGPSCTGLATANRSISMNGGAGQTAPINASWTGSLVPRTSTKDGW